MGCGDSKVTGSPDDIKSNNDINKLLKQEKSLRETVVKLLLLGAGESGKSTVAKQLRIIHLKGFSDEEKTSYKSIIYNNILYSMKALLRAVTEMNLEAVDPTVAEAILKGEASKFGQAQCDAVLTLWKHASIQTAYSKQSQFQLNDSAAYYFTNVERFVKPDFVPTEQDILRSRAKTTGIIEIEFVIEKTKFIVVDVGGQRSERKKWMHCFQDVTAVIFCVAMSEYDLKLYEDDETNRMMESLNLFKEICNSKWFMRTAMLLFLNKRDLFETKIQTIDLNICFPDYTGGLNYDNATSFIKQKFLGVNENNAKHVYVHITCATDTNNIQVVFDAVKDIILHQVLDESGLGF